LFSEISEFSLEERNVRSFANNFHAICFKETQPACSQKGKDLKIFFGKKKYSSFKRFSDDRVAIKRTDEHLMRNRNDYFIASERLDSIISDLVALARIRVAFCANWTKYKYKVA